MFINFSNHPSKLWAEDEKNAALQYGTIEDLAFPQVPAGAVYSLAKPVVMICIIRANSIFWCIKIQENDIKHVNF